jgi:phosphoglycerate kinase
MQSFRTIDDLDVVGRRVILRADLNVPFKDGRITDTSRIDAVAPTIAELSKAGARVIVLSHLGRPKGKPVHEFSLKPVAKPLADAVSRVIGHHVEVHFASDCIGDTAENAIARLDDGDIILLENVRFYPGEEANDDDFAKALAGLGDVYVDDAFSCAHRAHASTEGITYFLPSAAGRAMMSEIEALEKVLKSPAKPVVAIVGGAKVSTKLALLGNLVKMVDHLVIGGGMANTFLNAIGKPVGKSLCEHDLAETAKEIVAKAKTEKCTLHLPVDAVIAAEFKTGAASKVVPVDKVGPDDMILDIGPKTVEELTALLKNCKSLVWNGPLGAFEIPPFDAGTVAVAKIAAELTKQGKLLSVAGGGDTLSALHHAGVAQDFSHVSTAGGAFLEWLEGETLPGVAVLMNDETSGDDAQHSVSQ